MSDEFTDDYIYKFCNNNNDIICRCMNPDDSIIKIGEDLKLPYYCWYEPCKLKNALIVKSLKKNIERCNVSDCTITLGNINVTGGDINVKNVCGGISFFNNDIFRMKYLNQDIDVPIINPRWFPLLLISIVCLLFIMI
ncbi:MV entry-fusion complex protein [Cotia virus SPAn232]|uniref:MV entry-fusion complex protein n=2 Tax=Cotia virus TaxID=39444 RepID=H6TA60_9POXV|nr:MV entry-fusion complex protein [Cotia virus SPAn232]ADT91100.1 MV entry-fusion complex protein [Cotia virus SPAn232]AIT70701.1 MV entry-fusion complex protein [Cotia virus]